MKIQVLILYTTSLEKQYHFYTKTIGLKSSHKNDTSFAVHVGSSILEFRKSNESKPYHFAFNIPSNKVEEAYQWLNSKVTILPFEEKDIIDFPNWNAKAFYFYDKDNNIVEFISRKNLNQKSNTIFSSNSIINISEMGIGTSNIKQIYNAINELNPIEIFDGNFERFCAIGNEEGLFILVNKNIKNWFPTDDDVYESDFKIIGDYNFEYRNGKIINFEK
ncbi:VOC family protein [Urechidicola croceus]|uniref:VOC domain-containing protein n=1 Tax=Urechidicola croceus TaxID=1850246 RepID=A0A1D8PBC9_9FLAO|nr:VOC family protein [Urechidicola croceus]AOW21895.1 hypothetical protein LPB138_14905 [Urechidicola croceus]